MNAVTFWCQLERPAPDNPTRTIVTLSPIFGTEAELRGWVNATRRDGDMIHPWRRERGRDYSLRVRDEPNADPRRLLGELRKVCAGTTRPKRTPEPVAPF